MDAMMRNLVRQHSVERTVLELFAATDQRDWGRVRRVFTRRVRLDLGALSASAPGEVDADELVASWARGLGHLTSLHHQVGNLRSSVHDDDGHLTCYGTVYHKLPEDVGDELHIHVGTYDVGLRDSPRGWHIHTLRFRLKFTRRIPSADWPGREQP